ncbi:MAG: N-carbamoylputrescine amidase [Alphaproteobacteria bacterium]|nr:N-carbamoylputrescine amidase [Alphaproteobacteria bacterium]
MVRKLTIGVLQSALTDDIDENIDCVSRLARDAAAKGAQVILPSELFQGHYFCRTQQEEHFTRAHPWRTHPAVTAMADLAGALGVAIPISIFEKSGPHYYNSVVMADADGSLLGVYRKSHIPDGPGYQEKYYFRPGDTGFKVWETRHGRIGVGICWDQWFPEAARAMALMGADVLLYPSAIGAEPQDAGLDTAARWRRGMLGHAVANVIPVAAANRVGEEGGQAFYGTSFICDETGEVVSDLGRTEQGVAVASFDLEAIDRTRAAWGFFRDRRPDLYSSLAERRQD